MNYTREQLEEILDQLVGSWNADVRCAVAQAGYGFDRLFNDKNDSVRQAVARHGYALDVLLTDNDWRVRAEVAKHGYGLDILVQDRHSGVRMEVARRGYGLERLIDDDVWTVRVVVAQQGYGLDKLIHDAVASVRNAVANQGYGLDILVHDEDETVRTTALFRLRENDFKKLQISWGRSPTGFGAGNLDNISCGDSRKGILGDATCTVEHMLGVLNRVLYSPDWMVRRELAKLGFGLDTLVCDGNPYVRAAVVEHGYGLEVLAEDLDCSVAYAAREKLAQRSVDDILENASMRSVEGVRNGFMEEGERFNQWTIDN